MKKWMLWMMMFFQLPETACAQDFQDILITEVMADPSPQVQLPNQEYIELLNRTSDTIDLFGFYFIAGTDTCRIREHVRISPLQYVLLCRTAAVAELQVYGTCAGIPGFPSLDNEEEIIALLSAGKKVLHAIQYRSSLHQPAIKQKGGWSLEISDLRKPCITQGNYTSSMDPSGGTPGRSNSNISSINASVYPLNAFMPDSLTILLRFSGSLDSMLASRPAHYRFSSPVETSRIEVIPPLFNKVLIRLSRPIKGMLDLQSLTTADCSGSSMSVTGIRTAPVAAPSSKDLIITELMFNPSSGGYDYVEIFNNSTKSFDLRKIQLAGRNSSGSVQQSVALSEEEKAIYPGEYRVVTTDLQDLQLHFQSDAAVILQVEEMPTLPDDKGTVLITDEQGNILDEVNYRDDWHHPFISDPNGIALERLDPARPSEDKANWSSASSLIRGTPGKQNTQHLSIGASTSGIRFDRTIFSPDNDGTDDFLLMRYAFEQPGTMGNIRIYDVYGHLVRYLLNNELLSKEGWIRWDGSDDQQRRCTPGRYIFWGVFYTTRGTVTKIREAITVAKRF